MPSKRLTKTELEKKHQEESREHVEQIRRMQAQLTKVDSELNGWKNFAVEIMYAVERIDDRDWIEDPRRAIKSFEVGLQKIQCQRQEELEALQEAHTQAMVHMNDKLGLLQDLLCKLYGTTLEKLVGQEGEINAPVIQHESPT